METDVCGTRVGELLHSQGVLFVLFLRRLDKIFSGAWTFVSMFRRTGVANTGLEALVNEPRLCTQKPSTSPRRIRSH